MTRHSRLLVVLGVGLLVLFGACDKTMPGDYDRNPDRTQDPAMHDAIATVEVRAIRADTVVPEVVVTAERPEWVLPEIVVRPDIPPAFAGTAYSANVN